MLRSLIGMIIRQLRDHLSAGNLTQLDLKTENLNLNNLKKKQRVYHQPNAEMAGSQQL
jgi:hypothetical protein